MLAITRFRFGLVGALLLAAVPALAPPPAVAAPAPTVTRLSVHAGPTAGGVRVTITGRHLTPVRSVRFGSARATHVVVRSARKLVVTAPRHAAGLVDVRVVSAHGRSSARPADRFRYLAPPVVTRLSVSSGSVAGGSRVTVTGRNLVDVRTVTFGDAPGTAVQVHSPSSLSVTAPAHAAGVVDVRVTTRFGRSAASAADRFTYATGAVVPGGAWTGTVLPRPADAAGAPTVRSIACWGSGHCAAAGAYTDSGGDGAAVLWVLSGGTWAGARAPLPADAAADPRPLSDAISCGSGGVCAVRASYTAHRGGTDVVEHHLVWTLADGTWTGGLLPLPGDASTFQSATVEDIVCAGSTCAAIGDYSTAGNASAVLWARVGQTWAATKAPVPANAMADPPDDVGSLACEASGTCVASGSYSATSGWGGALWRLAAGGWTATAASLPSGVGAFGQTTGQTLHASCGAPGHCVATLKVTGGGGTVLAALDDGTWSPATLPLPADAGSGTVPGIDRTACSASGLCTVSGRYADTGGDVQAVLWTRIGTGAWDAVRAPLPANAAQNPRTYVRGLSCTDAGTCLAAGVYNYHAGGADVDEHDAFIRVLWTYAGGTWSLVPAFATTQQDQLFFGSGCGGSVCAAYGTAGQPSAWQVWRLASGTWQAYVPAPPSGARSPTILGSLTCGGATCAAVGSYADAAGATAQAVWLL